jgi:stage II sporulation protein D
MLLWLLLPQVQQDATTIRVLLQDGAKSVTLDCAGAVDLRGPYQPRPLLQFGKVMSLRIDLVDGKFRLLDREFDESQLTFDAKQEPIALGKRHYPQKLHLFRDKGSFTVVNEIDIETYVLGVVGAEIGAGSPLESIKAQAVAARSYASVGLDPRLPWNVYDDTRSQVYVGVPTKSSSVERAVRETAGRMIFFKGKIVRTYFSAACGGHTMGVREWTGAAEIPPLSGVVCGYCKGKHEWTRQLTLADLAAKLKQKKPLLRLSVKETTPSGRPATLLLELTGGRTVVPAKDLEMPTSMFTVTQSGDAVTIAGAGYGHGVGMCQNGAIEMGRKGLKYDQILAH